MRVADYDQFVRKTNQYASKPRNERFAIALYGLVGEIGSLVAAVKKKILAEGGATGWDQPNEEIKEELGDALWYAFALAQVVNDGPFDILANDIDLLRREISGENERAQKIRAALDPSTRVTFLEAAKSFPPPDGYRFDDYQALAFKTARTDGHVLLEVCLAVLFQLGAELLRSTLPDIEISLNKNVADRPTNAVLGEVTWHICAMASVYHLSMDDVVAFNCEKVAFRSERGNPTPLHDDTREPAEQFPRAFDVAFVPVGPRKSRMYVGGEPLGDDLTDNAYKDDGYRFHDVLHLAFIAHLGWSPVVRGFMKKKRKSQNDMVDEVEDGGRAKVVEELVIKAIHSEGERQAQLSGRCFVEGPDRLFSDPSLITFQLLKTLRFYVHDLEVWKNAYWEWENAIFEGCAVFFELCKAKQGTVTVDLQRRKLTFVPRVSANLQGITVGLGMGSAPEATDAVDARKSLAGGEIDWALRHKRLAETVAAKKAILEALGLAPGSSEYRDQLSIWLEDDNRVYVTSIGEVQERAWSRRALDYKVAFTRSSNQVICTATAVADISDIRK
jgi:NTP pyrophosphatase (non-canonical NTP hydrolase)